MLRRPAALLWTAPRSLLAESRLFVPVVDRESPSGPCYGRPLTCRLVSSFGTRTVFAECPQASLGVRILLREFGVPPTGPTVVYTDAKVAVDAALSERASQEAKWVAPRYAMIRRAQVDGAIEFR